MTITNDSPATFGELREELKKWPKERREPVIVQLLAEGIIDDIDAAILRGEFEPN